MHFAKAKPADSECIVALSSKGNATEQLVTTVPVFARAAPRHHVIRMQVTMLHVYTVHTCSAVLDKLAAAFRWQCVQGACGNCGLLQVPLCFRKGKGLLKFSVLAKTCWV